jgi:D-amino-acid dehydrogenase
MPTYDVAIIGGGAVGVATAHALASSGARVVLLERGELGRGCSYGNAGMVTPGHSLPLATPRALRQGLRWLLSGKGPFSVRLRADLALARWLLRYVGACRAAVMRVTIPALHNLAAASLARYQTLAGELPSFHFERRGWLYVYRSPDALAAEVAEATELRASGARWEAVDAAGLRELCPLLSEQVVGGIYYPDEAHVQPYAAVCSLAQRAREHGADLREGTATLSLPMTGGRVTAVRAAGESLNVGWCVLAAGAETPRLLRQLASGADGRALLGLGRRLPIQPAKGHSLTWPKPGNAPDLPLMLGEPHVIATPMGPNLRMTTGLDLVGFKPGLDPRRVHAIRAAAGDYLPGVEFTDEPEAWHGYRPLTPDSRPIIGPVQSIPNLILAVGHGQLGITLAPITGALVAALIRGEPAPVDPAPFLPARFGL